MKALSQIVEMKNAGGSLDKNPRFLVSPRHIVELEQLLQKEIMEFEVSSCLLMLCPDSVLAY